MTTAGVRAEPLMGTVVTIQVVGHDDTPAARAERDDAIERAFEWCRHVEQVCSRFDPSSELSRLSATSESDVEVSELLFRALEFACALAAETDGAFDPTVGHAMTAHGFDRHFRTGEHITAPRAEGVTYRDIELDPSRLSVRLARPMQLDLGAVAKGLAIDLAARELTPLRDFVVDGGGDLFCSGANATHSPWRIGIRHPRDPKTLLGQVTVSDAAICTSGDYLRRDAAGGHHLLNPSTGESAVALASVTVVAPTALVADGLSTAAFVLGPDDGTALLERAGVSGLLVAPDLSRTCVGTMDHAFLPHA